MFSVKNPKTGGCELVPCGHCVNCLADMQAEWATRLTIEFEYNKQRPAVFFTLHIMMNISQQRSVIKMVLCMKRHLLFRTM